ncbi:arginase family protein [Corallococcus terminator]|uniref:Arginase family protein n=1 Tax=Corallococcus terminator TaxID=2316733 RepID=A0A3A8H7L7_9BACT|nr:arginase family protein [Corallococcus terminator]RKG67139.1 arginase family protein [Corallococcus terminator]
MSPRLRHALCSDEHRARAVLFGANTQGAGFSESVRGRSDAPRTLFTADFMRDADNESPSLTESLEDGDGLFDAGNLPVEGLAVPAQLSVVRDRFASLFRRGQRAIGVGGDHHIKYAALAAVNDVFEDCGVVYVDAHPDCAQSDALAFDSILHHAWKLPHVRPERTSLFGIRQVNAREREGLRAWKPGVIHAVEVVERGLPAVLESMAAQLGGVRRVFVSVDLDGLAPHEVPAVEAPYPGGPTFRELLVLLRGLARRYELVGLDVSEFIPELDPARLTALVTARLVKEFAALPSPG